MSVSAALTRWVAALGAALAAVAATVGPWPALARASGESAPPSVQIGLERLEGVRGSRHPEVLIFKGVPFAAPPVGRWRWQAPQPYRARPGRRNAGQFAAACMQNDYNLDWYREVARAFGEADLPMRNPPFSEDCLYLNVWTPSLDPGAKRPVLVWIHGGANKAGWSFEPNYDGENLAAHGAVIVSIAYRLGIFGFFGHPELRSSSAPDNFGLLDQIAALRWVRAHIAKLGGDPGNVTVAGESAGAGDIGYLLSAPPARGLFRRAISESGGFQLLEHGTQREEEQVGVALAAALPGAPPNLAAMRALDGATLLEAATRALAQHDYGPVTDGRSVIEPPAAALRRGIPVDLLIGTNANEWYMYENEERASLEHAIAALPPALHRVLHERAALEPSVQHANDAVYSLPEMHCAAYALAGAVHAAGHRAFVYRFTRVRPGPGGEALLAYHGAEIPYVFDTQDTWLTGDAVDARLGAAMQADWLAFMRNGDPNEGGAVGADRAAGWPEFGSGLIEELGTRVGPMAPPDRALCREIAAELYR